MKKFAFVLLVLSVFITEIFTQDIYKDIIQPGQDLVGTPYISGGITPSGFDCSGFVNYLYKRFVPAIPRISRNIATFGKPVDRRSISPGDLVFFATGRLPGITHIAIYIGQDSILHAISNGPDRGVTISNLSSRYWNKRYVSACRILQETAAPGGRVSNYKFAKGLYTGEVVNGEPEGEGILVMNNGDRYEGMFSKGNFNGEGSYYWANGENYTGEFKNGNFEEPSLDAENYIQKKDSPWESFDGIIEGDFQLWLEQDKDEFEEWKKNN